MGRGREREGVEAKGTDTGIKVPSSTIQVTNIFFSILHVGGWQSRPIIIYKDNKQHMTIDTMPVYRQPRKQTALVSVRSSLPRLGGR